MKSAQDQFQSFLVKSLGVRLFIASVCCVLFILFLCSVFLSSVFLCIVSLRSMFLCSVLTDTDTDTNAETETH